jgi:hypothetical protein
MTALGTVVASYHRHSRACIGRDRVTEAFKALWLGRIRIDVLYSGRARR